MIIVRLKEGNFLFVSLLEIILIGIGLSMDAFAVSVCKGLSMHKMNWKRACIIALYFGIFQALMPFIGYFLGSSFQELVSSIDHWIAFFLLSIIGGNMIKDSFQKESHTIDEKINFKSMLLLSIATSIDALAVGVTFALLQLNIVLAISIIGILTFIISILGVKIGNRFGNMFQNKAELTGGVILIGMGFKILLEHLGILVL